MSQKKILEQRIRHMFGSASVVFGYAVASDLLIIREYVELLLKEKEAEKNKA